MRPRYATALIVLVALAASIAGIGNAFVQDDIPIVAGDFRLHDVTQWPRLLVEPYWPPPYAPDQYRPLASLLLSVEFIAGGGSPVAVRLASYLLYSVASLAVWRLALLLFPGRERLPLAAALLFAAHPVHVEATALGVGQAELLMTTFVVLALIRYLRLRAVATTGWRPWIGVAALYLAAGASKEQGLLLPAFLVAAELLVVRAPFRESRRELARASAALGAVAVLLVTTRIAVLGAPAAPVNVAETLLNAPLSVRIATALQLVPHWARLLVWPAHLRLDYSPQEFVASTGVRGTELAGIAIVLILIGIAWGARRRAPVVSFGIVFTALALAPVANVIVATGVLVAERTLFLPSVGVVLAMSGAAAWVAGRPHPALLRRAAAAAVVLAVVAGVARSATRHLVWKNEESLTLAAVVESPRSWRAQLNHANLLFERGERPAAMQAYERAIALAPSSWQVRHAYARRLRATGDEHRALEQLGLSLVEEPSNNEAMRDMIAVLLALGRYAEARALVMQVISRGEMSPELLQLGRLADSALAVKAPPGSIKIGTRDQTRAPSP